MPKKILVVDDEAEVREYLKDVLEERGYTVGLAQTGREALNKLSVENFDLILLDLIMPDLDGFEVLKAIRSSNTFLPIIILTAYVTEKKLKEATRLGATNFIDKRVGIDELINKIESCFNLPHETGKERIDILAVEDEPTVAGYIKDVLTEEGYRVKTANRGEEAITLVIKNNPRIILLDIMLPGIDGIETLRQIRKIDQEVIVFFISAHMDTVNELDKYTLDVYAELKKPIAGKELKRYVREALDSKKK